MLGNRVNLSRAAFPKAPVREQELRYLMACTSQGQCCSVVAPSNMGKSLLLKSLTADEVRRACAADGPPVLVAVFVDCLEAGTASKPSTKCCSGVSWMSLKTRMCPQPLWRRYGPYTGRCFAPPRTYPSALCLPPACARWTDGAEHGWW
jgi:hypothetical protein